MMYDKENTLAKNYLMALENQPAIEEYLLDNLSRYRTIIFFQMIPLTKGAETALKRMKREVNLGSDSELLIDSSHLLLSMLRNRKYPFPTLSYEEVKHHFDNLERK